MADKNIFKQAKRLKIRRRIRRKVSGTSERPRLTIYRSLNHIYAQLIDDVSGSTLVQTSSLAEGIRAEKSSGKISKSKQVGLELAKAAISKGISKVVFDRNGLKYHGRIKAVADGAREGGLEF
jgi:large subunit ribosomal protein L18